MTLEIRVSHQETYMSAKVAGHASVQDVREVFDALSDESMRMNSRRLLVDLRRVDEKFDMADHLIVSAAAATNLAHLEKVATLVAMGRKKGTTEEAARQRGVVLRTFTSETEAVSWLEAW